MMKNIVWQQPDASLGIYNLPDEEDSAARAQQLIDGGLVDSEWVAVAFDVEQFPNAPQSTWRFVEGEVGADAALVARAETLQQLAILRAEVAALESGYPHGIRIVLINLAEKEAAAVGAARVPPLTREQSIAAAYMGNSGYRTVRDLHDLVATKEAQIVDLEAQL